MGGRSRAVRQPAAELPVARVCVDTPLPHLDRPFDYLVAEADAEAAQPGTRVRVRFGGQLVDGWLLERVAASEHAGKLLYLERVVSPERVLRPEILRAARAVADRYAGSLADVLRLAVPPRHAAVEAEPAGVEAGTAWVDPGPAASVDPGPAASVDAAAPVEAEPATGEAASAGHPAAPVDAAVAGEAPASMDSGPAVSVDPGPAAPVDAAASVDPGPAAPVDAGTAASAASAVTGGSAAAATPAFAGGPAATGAPDPGWDAYPAGRALLRALREGRAPRAVWTSLPGEPWPTRFAEAAAAVVARGQGAVLVVADARDLDRLDDALTRVLGPGRHVALSAALGPAERYRRFLRACRGQVPVVAGTRAAALAPVANLGLVAIWDDGDDLHSEPRAPYPHAREVLLLRAQLTGAAVLVGGFTRTAEAQQLLETGWARPVTAARATVRERAPRISPVGDDAQLARDPAAAAARLPSLAWQAARRALADGAPVLVQVPRRGYLPAVACERCRTPARCPHCAGPLQLTAAHATASCRWCARPAVDHRCRQCGARRLRASVTGAGRTAEELGKAFPGYPVRTSGRDRVLASVPARPALVVATPGAEPVAEGGYGAVLLLDTWALLTRADLRAGEETLRRWLAAAALARPAGAGGRVVVVADGGLPPVQALLRFDPGWYAERELAERRALGFPPAARVATVTGPPAAVADLLAVAELPAGTEVLGPVPVGEQQERMLLRAPRSAGGALAAALHAAAGVRSARKATDPVRIQVDPLDLL